MLTSLKNQSLSVNEEKLNIFIDGFVNSSYQQSGKIDLTFEVEIIARNIFPKSRVIKFKKNLGVAGLFLELQSTTFAGESNWAAFFEEDLVLSPNYLFELDSLINLVEDCDEIVQVACFQVLPSLISLPRGLDGFYPGHGTKAFAERKMFYLDSVKILKSFIEIEQNKNFKTFHSTKKSPMVKDSKRISKLAGPEMLGTIINSFNKDLALSSYIAKTGKLHVVSKPNLASDIGIEGLHFYTTPKLKISDEINIRNISQAERKVELLNTIPYLRTESVNYYSESLRIILDGYYISLSSRKMCIKILKNLKLRMQRYLKSFLLFF
jgi:hypothetical protein